MVNTVTPIVTIITNNARIAKTFYWAGRSPIWLEPGGKIELPYDVWSVGTDQQHTSMRADIAEGTVSVDIKIATDFKATSLNVVNGVVTVPFVPVIKSAKKIQENPDLKKPREIEVKDAAHEFVEHTDDHIIMAGSVETSQVAGYYGFKDGEVERPVTEIKNGVAVEEVKVQEFEAPEPPEENPDKTGTVDEEDVEKQFDALLAEKQYDDAFALLKNQYGEKKITFSIRAVRAAKSFASLKSRYKF